MPPILPDMRESVRDTFEEAIMELFLGIPIWLLFGIIGAWIATTKGRSGCGWFLLCSILGPIGLILAAVISKKG